MNIYSIYIGKNLNQEISDSEELFDEMYGLKTVRIKSKRENKNGESMDTVFLLNSVSNQHFKVPKRIFSWATMLRNTIRFQPLLTLPPCLEKSFS